MPMSGRLSQMAGPAAVLFAALVASSCRAQGVYTVTTEVIGANTERKFRLDGFHFGTLTDVNQEGTYNFRPRPGSDVNGFGSSLYFQPFLAEAVLRGTVIDDVTVSMAGIRVEASGIVSRDTNDSFGTWTSDLLYVFDPVSEEIVATGTYTIALSGFLSVPMKDLNLYRLASNYLNDVPLVTGGEGDTGDMHYVEAIGDTFTFMWFPPEMDSFFPTDETDDLTVDMQGQYNIVDTAAQGHAPIADVFKPSVRVTLQSATIGIPMTFGALYDTSVAQDFAADNIGVTPLIKQAATQTMFHFNVTVESEAIETSENHVWTGGGADDRFTNPENWSPEGIPAANWIVDLNNNNGAAAETAEVDRDTVIRQLRVRGTAGPMELMSNAGRTLTVTDALRREAGGTLRFSGGTTTFAAGRDGDP